MYISQEIAERIKIVAKSKNIPLKQLFEDVGLGSNTMANLKTSFPKVDNLAKIADYLDCSIDYLIGRVKQKNIPTDSGEENPNKRKLINNFDLLNAEGQQDLIEYSDMLAGNPRKIKESDKAVPIDA